jgi:hypothetical protein
MELTNQCFENTKCKPILKLLLAEQRSKQQEGNAKMCKQQFREQNIA